MTAHRPTPIEHPQAQAAHGRIHQAVCAHRSSKHALAVELLHFDEQGHAYVFGFGSTAAYAREVHQLTPPTTRDLLHLARCLRTLPALDAAVRDGLLPWTKARTLVPVLTEDNEQDWLDVAGVESVRTQVVDLVSEGPSHGRRSRSVPPRVRRVVLHAYGGCCAVPGCTSRRWVDLHHIRPFAEGGGHSVENLLPLCPAHHRLHHHGRMGLEKEQGDWVFRFSWGPERRRRAPHVGRPASHSDHEGVDHLWR